MDNIPDKGSVRDYLKSDKVQRVTIPNMSDDGNIEIPLHRPDHPPKLIRVGQLHYRDINGKAISEDIRFVRELIHKDEPYRRTIIIGEEWVKIDTAWIQDIGYLLFRNNGGKPFQVVPTQEQMNEAWSRIIQVGYEFPRYSPERKVPQKRTAFEDEQDVEERIEAELLAMTKHIEPFWSIYPGESMEGRPTNNRPIYLRCQHGEVSVTIFAISS